MENSYISLSEAINELQKEGYTEDFNLHNEGMESKKHKKVCNACDLEVVKYYRFEGMSNPDDNSILYVIETSDGNKGLLVDNYSAGESNVSIEMIEKLRITHNK